MNIPNFLTIGRILLIPLLVIFLIERKLNEALLIFLVAGITDGLDGFLARILKQKTEFGAFLDPLADKLLLITSYTTLAVLGLLPKWLAVVVVSRDLIIWVGVGILMLHEREFAFKPSLVSKLTTFFQLVTVVFHLGQEYLQNFFGLVLYLDYATAIFTIISGIHYLSRGIRILDQEKTK